MKTKGLAIAVAVGIFVFVGLFFWAALRGPAVPPSIAGATPTASIAETLPDGRLEVQVFALADRNVRLDIRFTPDATAADAAGLRPVVKVAMAMMQMNGIAPPVERVEAGVWRADLTLPMAGRWVASVGIGADIAEVEFDAN